MKLATVLLTLVAVSICQASSALQPGTPVLKPRAEVATQVEVRTPVPTTVTLTCSSYGRIPVGDASALIAYLGGLSSSTSCGPGTLATIGEALATLTSQYSGSQVNWWVMHLNGSLGCLLW